MRRQRLIATAMATPKPSSVPLASVWAITTGTAANAVSVGARTGRDALNRPWRDKKSPRDNENRAAIPTNAHFNVLVIKH